MTPKRTTLFVCGDVMTGRGIDQAFAQSVPPQLYEPFVRSARDYVELAERASGPIARPVALDYVWGDALAELAARRPDARIANLETAITLCEDAWPGKGIHYRMHPANVGCLAAAGIDCCTLANNHVLDWGRTGLAETLATLRAAGIRATGAGRDLREAAAPAPEQRAFAHGVIDEAGVDLVHGHSSHHVKAIEVHTGRLVLHGCGDLLNDYEGIGGHEAYHAERALMYFPTLDAEGALLSLTMVPTLARRFRLQRGSREDAAWLADRLTREGHALGTRASAQADHTLRLDWN